MNTCAFTYAKIISNHCQYWALTILRLLFVVQTNECPRVRTASHKHTITSNWQRYANKLKKNLLTTFFFCSAFFCGGGAAHLSGFYRTHYVEYLVSIVAKANIDPLAILDLTDCVQELRRRGIPLPDRGPWDTDPIYRGMCQEVRDSYFNIYLFNCFCW